MVGAVEFLFYFSSFSQGTGLGFAEDGNIGKLPGGRSWIRFLSFYFFFLACTLCSEVL